VGWPQPIALEGHGVRLEPLTLAHEDGLRDAAADGELWQLRVTSVPEPENTRSYIEAALKGQAEGHMLPWVVVDASNGRVLGSTRYHDVLPAIKRVEIGYTWYRKSAQRTHVNTACKLLMMTHAFEALHCPVVGWRTDILNFASQRAIERLGARRDGVLRHQAQRRDGTVRDGVMYSMSADEWPAAKTKLLERIHQGGFSGPAFPAADRDVRLATLEELTASQVSDLARMSPGALGERMVAPNGVSIAQAGKSANAWLRAIMAGNQPVGLLMLYDPTLAPALAAKDGEAADAIILWRLMIGFHHQGKGYGEAAMQLAFAYAKTRPGITRMLTSHMPYDGNPGPFYQRLGFRHTGEVNDGELVMERALGASPAL
jgi:RimJ/RimL family protein N-acetyltransferase